jgi:GDP-D-mannose dehydratase
MQKSEIFMRCRTKEEKTGFDGHSAADFWIQKEFQIYGIKSNAAAETKNSCRIIKRKTRIKMHSYASLL